MGGVVTSHNKGEECTGKGGGRLETSLSETSSDTFEVENRSICISSFGYLGNELHPEKVKGQSPSDPLLFDLVSVQCWKSRVPTGNLEYQQKVIIFVPFHIIKMYLTFH